MNSARRLAALLLIIGIAGCKHKVQSAAPPPPAPPVFTPTQIADKAPLPQPPAPQPVDVKLGSDKKQEPTPVKQKKPPHHKSKPSEAAPVQTAKDATPPATAPAQAVSAGQPPNTSPIGQLSSSSDSSSGFKHQDIQKQINDTESGLNGIISKRKLSSDEEQTAAQIQTFLEKAKKALNEDDLDGANTLVKKAAVLLEELTKG
ncbi:MAG: hypothetical protein JO300_12935 [Silvibacterium sp.]|nr:hypothetical protein [Silvibacterium sp.]MBV8438845.1 hypothetical protein [Silvibacterium sp.]